MTNGKLIVLDTHVLYWLVAGNEQKIGDKTRQIIETAWQENGCLVSAFSFWEIAMLNQKQKIQLAMSAANWRKQLLSQGFIEVAVTGDIGVLSTQLDLHGDPADRIIAATAIVKQATLITADNKLLSWQHEMPRQAAHK